MKETEKELEVRERAIESIVSRLAAGCSQEEFLTLKCPVCGAGLSLFVWNRRLFHVRCKRNPKHIGVYQEAKVWVEWWANFMAKGDLNESDEEFEKRKRAIQAIISQLLAGCSQEEFLKFKCPVCGSGLSLSVHPNRRTFSVSCKQNSTHIAVTEEAGRSIDWWNNFVSGGWYSEDPEK